MNLQRLSISLASILIATASGLGHAADSAAPAATPAAEPAKAAPAEGKHHTKRMHSQHRMHDEAAPAKSDKAK